MHSSTIESAGIRRFGCLKQWQRYALVAGLAGLIFLSDLATSAAVPLNLYYIIPIAFSAWSLDRRFTYLLVLLSSFAGTYALSGIFPNNYLPIFACNVLQSFAIFTLVEIAICKLNQYNRLVASESISLDSELEHRDQQISLDATIRLALPKDVYDIARLAAEGAIDGDLSNDAIKRQNEYVMACKDVIDRGVTNRAMWEGGQALVRCDYWVSVVNDTVVAYAVVIGVNGKDEDRELSLISVSRNNRQQGIGTALVNFFCNHYRGRRLILACKDKSIMMGMAERRKFNKKLQHSSSGYFIMEKYSDMQ